MTTATKSIMDRDLDALSARRFADQMVHTLDRFIPDAARQEAWDMLAKLAYDNKFELTTLAMRNEYLAWKKINLDVPFESSLLGNDPPT